MFVLRRILRPCGTGSRLTLSSLAAQLRSETPATQGAHVHQQRNPIRWPEANSLQLQLPLLVPTRPPALSHFNQLNHQPPPSSSSKRQHLRCRSFSSSPAQLDSPASAMATIYYEPSGCNCANRTEYDRDAIDAACQKALQLASQSRSVGHDHYPHAYNDYEHFKFDHAKPPYLEFPIMSSGRPFDGDHSPGADRVVIGSIARDFKSAVYCAVLTHDGKKKNGFAECKDDTANQGGDGTYDVNKTEGWGLAPPEDRGGEGGVALLEKMATGVIGKLLG